MLHNSISHRVIAEKVSGVFRAAECGVKNFVEMEGSSSKWK